MMTALVIGGDRLGKIPSVLEEYGISSHVHWSGRKKKMRKFKIPKDTDVVILFYDFLEHNMMDTIKVQAKQKNIPCIFSRRACSDLAMRFNNCKECDFTCNNI